MYKHDSEEHISCLDPYDQDQGIIDVFNNKFP